MTNTYAIAPGRSVFNLVAKVSAGVVHGAVIAGRFVAGR
jgi:hypothetical protein